MIEAAKTAGISKLLDCINVVVDDVASSLTEEEIIDMANPASTTSCLLQQDSRLPSPVLPWMR